MLLDELNLASQSVLEGLNSCLDHRARIFIPELGREVECPPTFRIFACQVRFQFTNAYQFNLIRVPVESTETGRWSQRLASVILEPLYQGIFFNLLPFILFLLLILAGRCMWKH